MTITQLTYVLAVAEYKNFTLASEKCFVTQPTLSMQIQKLEEELDVTIFNRKKKPIALTPIGEKIIEQAKIIINESNRITDIVDQQKGFIGGEFKLGIIPTVMPTLLPLFLKTFIKKYPKVNLIIEEQTTEDIIQNLTDGHLDAGIAATPLEVHAIKEKVLYYEPFVGFLNSNHRLFSHKDLSVEDLDIDDILLLEDGHCFKDNIINLCNNLKKEDPHNFKLESGSFDTLVKLTKEGLGMTLLPYLQTYDLKESDKKSVRSFKSPTPSREVSIIYHKSQLKIQLIDALKEVIDGVIRGVIAFSDVKIISPLKK
ncbi:LysR substrate-binding domain-containing protein [Aureibaculum sp. 2210JD6-5]|uniref:LysR family transcriptional regulator n=1 Tax=Aureibaculum sp. 2210JD6-5 TaxID=3103957 RepID=UPI002AADB234|nr:LysR substrate-binding domain-containing protein [Aureibaculum sp. 2210JD6-5]MDY7393795.1 LysR substrate-binding domain-containing protein [Aureibaculum sp. 2210JD6-5]